MPELRETLREMVGPARDVDLGEVRRRAAALRRRRVVAASATAVMLVSAIALLVVLQPDTTNRSSVTTPTPTAPTAPPSTTLPPVADRNAEVIASDPARSLDPTIPPCRAEDFVFVRLREVPTPRPDGAHLGLFFENRTAEPCALLSYPLVEGLTEEGQWFGIPVSYDDLEPVSSYPWTGLVEPDRVPIVTALELRGPSWYGGQCPAPGPTSTVRVTRFTALRLVLRAGTGVIDVPMPFEAAPCEVVLRRFGDDSQDALGQ